MSSCYVCGGAPAADADLRSPTCDRCRPVRDHVVSMQGDARLTNKAVCQCGWEYTALGQGGAKRREQAVRIHWRLAIESAAA